MVYGLDFERSIRDPIEAVFNGYAHMVMMYIVAITAVPSRLAGGCSRSLT